MRISLGVVVLLSLASLGPARGFAQAPGISGAGSRYTTLPQTKSRHYEIYAEGGREASEKLAKEMESRFEVYNRLFRFEESSLPPLRVVAFESADAFDSYVKAQLGRTREGAVYLHYQRPERRELIMLRRGGASDRFAAHQAFVQFLRAFLPNPPSWIRDGFAVYFSTLGFNENGAVEYEENLAWLDTVKAWGRETPSLDSVLLADIQGSFEKFVPASWALVSFFLNSGNIDYQRTLFESFMLLRPEAGAAENSRIVQEYMNSWINASAFAQDYRSYFESRKTFAELVDLGKASYQTQDHTMAEMYFLQAIELKPGHYAPYYYLGIMAYERKNWDLAEFYYESALENGADRPLTLYALGINALSAGKTGEARALLNEAAEADPARYKDKAGELLQGIQ
jgi:tetratricopeptide (TPR) repeat protein